MLKKVSIGAICIAVIVLIIFGYNHFKSLKQSDANIWHATNPNSLAIISSNDFNDVWNRLNESNLIWEELKQISGVDSLNSFLSQIDSLIATSENLSSVLQSKHCLLSIIPSGSEKASLQLSYVVPNGLDFEDFVGYFGNQMQLGDSKIYDEVEIHEWQLNNRTLFGTIVNNYLLISPSSIVIEESVRSINRENHLLNDSHFKSIKETAGLNAKANVYVNYSKFGGILKTLFNKNYSSWSKVISSLGHWASLDFDLKSNSIILNGFTNTLDSANHFLDAFNNQAPQELTFKEFLPNNTALFLNIGVSSFSDYLDNYRNWLDNTGRLNSYRKGLERLNDNYGVNTSALAINWIGSEIGVAYTEMNSPSQIAQHKLLVFKASNILNAQRDLKTIAEQATSTLHTENYRGHIITYLGVKNLYGSILGSGFSGINNVHYTTINDYVIFANSTSALRNVITKYKVNKTLIEDDVFDNFNSQLNSEGNVLIYGNLAGSINHLHNFFGNETAGWIKQNTEHLSNFQSFAFEWAKEDKNLFYQHAIINYNPSYKQETGSLWELNLEEAEITTKPLFVKNHYNNNREVLVQDNEFNLYLISNVGKLLWKKQLKEKIIGDPVQIDAYKNNKFQYVFVTKNQLHLIDRNGNYVEGFPKTLLSRATTSLTVLDYDKNRKYRMLVGCEDGSVYSYNNLGEIVKGWKFSRGTSAIGFPPKHFTIGKKDYILIVEHNGKIHLVNRRGENRHSINVDLKNPSFQNNVFVIPGKDISKSHLYYSTRDGKLVKLQLNGSQTNYNLNLSDKHLFTVDDVNNDGIFDLIFGDKNNILIYNLTGKLIEEHEFEGNINGFLQTYHFPGGIRRIGFTIPEKQEIHLINYLGKEHNGFPLFGGTDFSIADINKERFFSLVTADAQGKIYTYNLN